MLARFDVKRARVVRALLALAVVAVAAVAAGCSLLPTDYTVHVSNSTTLPLTVVVNGAPLAVLEPNTSADYSPSTLPAMPWTVQTTLASGRVLASMRVEEGSIQDHRALDGTGSYQSVGDLEILSCGQVWLWVGERSSGGPAREGQPGDCGP